MITTAAGERYIPVVIPDPVRNVRSAFGVTGLCPLEILFLKKQQALHQICIGGKKLWSRCCLGGKEAGESTGVPEACSVTRAIDGGSK